MTPVADPFMAGVPVRRPGDFTRSKQGTPYVSDPTGALTKPKNKKDPGHVKRLAYGRPSGLGKQIEDMYSIQKWAERQLCLGFALEPSLTDEAAKLIVDDHDTEGWRSDADGVVVAAKRVAKAGLAADRGTHAHELTEDDDNDRDIIARIEAGEELGLGEMVQRSLVEAWREMLERDGLEILAVEATVVHDGYRQAGTLDRIARLTKPLRFTILGGEIVELAAGTVLILDIKSGKRRRRVNGTAMYWQSYAVQVAVYAGAVPYDTETDERGTWPFEIDQRWAVIAHLDVLGALDGNPTCDLILVDIEAGRRAADLCLAAKAWEAEHTAFSIAQLEVEGTTLCKICGGTGKVTVGDGDYEGASCHDELCPACDSPAASPVAAVTAGEGVGGSGPSPANSIHDDNVSRDQLDVSVEVEALPGCRWGKPVNAKALPTDISQGREMTPEVGLKNEASVHAYSTTTDAKTILTPDPARMALVDARASLTVGPDEGADLAVGFDELWDNLKELFDTLDPAARSWRSDLVNAAQRHLVPFHVQSVRTERTWNLNRGLIALALAGGDNDEMLRALLALIIGDVALFPGVHAGHALGSLNATEAERFAALVDVFNGPGLAAYIDADGLFRLEAPAAA